MEVYVLAYKDENGKYQFAKGGAWHRTKIRAFTSLGRAKAAVKHMTDLPENVQIVQMITNGTVWSKQ